MKLFFPTNKNILSASSKLESCFITENQVVILTESDTEAAWIYCIKYYRRLRLFLFVSHNYTESI